MSYPHFFPDVVVPDSPLAAFILESSRRYGDKIALIDGSTDRTLTYREFIDAVRTTAGGLARRGIEKGDVIAVYGPNSPEYMVALHAVAMLGAVVTTPSPLSSVAHLAYQLKDSGTRLLIAAPALEEVARTAASRAGVEQVVTPDGLELRSGDGQPGDTGSSMDGQSINPAEECVALPYSRGPSGLPMGAILTHRNVVANIVQTQAIERIDESDTLVVTMPFHNMSGIVMASVGLCSGATVVTLARFDPQCFLGAMDRYEVTRAYVIPALLGVFRGRPAAERDRFPKLRQFVCLATRPAENLAKADEDRHDSTVRYAYSLTETGLFTHFTPENQPRVMYASVPVPNTEFRIVDVVSQNDLEPGKIGEVWIRGPHVMKGYLNDLELTRRIIDDQAWLRTGYIGQSDAEGMLHVVERASELVRLRGLHYRDDELLMATVDEIAARREAAERVSFQAVLLDSVRESVVGTDLHNHVTFWNKGAERLFGYSAEEVFGQPVDLLIIPPEEDARVAPEKATALRSQGRWNAQVIRHRKDGTKLWTDLVVSVVRTDNGQRLGFVGIHRDITEQKRVEARLRFQAQLLDSVRESVVATDIADRLVFWGKGAEVLFGYSAADMLGQPLAPLTATGGNLNAEFGRIKQEVLEKGVWSGQASLFRRDGSQFVADIVLAPVKDEEGETVGLIVIHRDVSELRRNQDLLKDSHERLRNLAARLLVIREQERSAIARELHDELGQALTRLSIDLSWLTQSLPRSLKNKRTKAMGPLVDRMLETVQHISSELRPPILDDLGLEAAVEWQAQEFANWSGCRCRLDLRIGRLPRHRDRDIAVFRILQEALTNIARHAKAHTVVIRAWAADGEFVLEVEDDGIGIADSKLSSSHSLGIIGMRERAEGLGGSIFIGTRGKQGSIVSVRVRIPAQTSETGIHPIHSALS